MAELKIYGHSDDLLEFEGVLTTELDVWGASDRTLYYEIVDEHEGNGYIVTVNYNGRWNFKVDNILEGNVVNWNAAIETAHTYSSMVHFYDCPDQIKIRQIGEWIHSTPRELR